MKYIEIHINGRVSNFAPVPLLNDDGIVSWYQTFPRLELSCVEVRSLPAWTFLARKRTRELATPLWSGSQSRLSLPFPAIESLWYSTPNLHRTFNECSKILTAVSAPSPLVDLPWSSGAVILLRRSYMTASSSALQNRIVIGNG